MDTSSACLIPECVFFHAGYGCTLPKDKCPAVVEGTPDPYPVVTRKTLRKVAYMVTRRVYGYPVVLNESFVSNLPLERFLVHLSISEVIEHPSYSEYSFVILMVDGLPAYDMRHLAHIPKKVSLGYPIQEGTSVYEALVFQSYVSFKDILGALRLKFYNIAKRPGEAVLYTFR